VCYGRNSHDCGSGDDFEEHVYFPPALRFIHQVNSAPKNVHEELTT
jgi:hypothetical protein